MPSDQPTPAPATRRPTGALVLADGSVFWGRGLGETGEAIGEVCFNTAVTGYQEILTDPSYAAQIVTFTFPHIGNVGANEEDVEASSPAAASAARGVVVRADVTAPSNYRAASRFDDWLQRRGLIGLSGVDTRALTIRIRETGMPHAAIAHDPNGAFDVHAMAARAAAWSGLEGLDLAKDVTTAQTYISDETVWTWPDGFSRLSERRGRIVCMDFGVKRNILRLLAANGFETVVVPATASAEDVLGHRPDGVLLSNGPGDPAATATYAAPQIAKLIDRGVPIMGICLGHQILALTLGGKTRKMKQGHHGANHPVQDIGTGKVEIVSMNHGFTVDRDSLPAGVHETHVSLFDGTNCGIAVEGKPIFSVQHHPEASPGPQDSFYLFERFADAIASARA